MELRGVARNQLNSQAPRDGATIIISVKQSLHGLSAEKGVRRPSVDNEKHVSIGKGHPGACALAAFAATGNVDDILSSPEGCALKIREKQFGVRSSIWSSFCSMEYTIVSESGMEFGVQYGVLFVVWSTQ